MNNPARPMSMKEYQRASETTRRLHSQLIAAQEQALREAIAALDTAAGRVSQRRQAQAIAADLARKARMAELIAQRAELERKSTESQAVGRKRLAAANAEVRALWKDAR